MMNESSNTMVLPLGQKTSPGTITALHMFNNIIRLEAVAKIITNKTTRSLNLLAKQPHM
jgi:hypothetical protein